MRADSISAAKVLRSLRGLSVGSISGAEADLGGAGSISVAKAALNDGFVLLGWGWWGAGFAFAGFSAGEGWQELFW
jgi:hypothetical protein